MRARTFFFWGALACSMFSAAAFTVGWLHYDHEATVGEKLWQQNLLLDSGEESEVVNKRYWGDTYLLLVKVVPASILAAWFMVSWIVFGRDAFRLVTIKSHFSALLKSGRRG